MNFIQKIGFMGIVAMALALAVAIPVAGVSWAAERGLLLPAILGSAMLLVFAVILFKTRGRTRLVASAALLVVAIPATVVALRSVEADSKVAGVIESLCTVSEPFISATCDGRDKTVPLRQLSLHAMRAVNNPDIPAWSRADLAKKHGHDPELWLAGFFKLNLDKSIISSTSADQGTAYLCSFFLVAAVAEIDPAAVPQPMDLKDRLEGHDPYAANTADTELIANYKKMEAARVPQFRARLGSAKHQDVVAKCQSLFPGRI